MKKYYDTVIDSQGNAVSGASVVVTSYPSDGAVSIYLVNNTASPVAASTLTTDVTGFFYFYAPDGQYILKIYDASGNLQRTIADVQIVDDAAQEQFSENIADLRLVTGTIDGQIISISGYYTVGDGGGGSFYWDSSSSTADNGGTVIKPTAVGGAGRWIALGNYLDVRRFGAKGDDISDDTSAIQAAATAAAGSIIFFPEGDFLISAAIRASENTTFMGCGYGSRLRCEDAGWTLGTTDNYGLINVKNVSKVRITNLRLYSTKLAAATETPKIIYFETVDGLTVDHNWLENSQFEGIWEGGTQANNKNIIIESNHIDDVGHPAGAFVGLPAIQFNATQAVIANNRLFNVGTGIGASGDKISITGNFIKGVTTEGIATGDGADNGVITISGNTVEFDEQSSGNPRKGIKLGGGSGTERSINCVGNTVRVIGTAGIGSARGIYSDTAQNVVIADNVVEIDVRGIGIEVLGTAAGTTAHVHSNTVRVSGESGASACFTASPNGGGNTLTLRSAGNRAYGVTRAASSYAFDYNNNAGGTLNVSLAGDLAPEGSTRVDDVNYNGAELNIDGLPLFDSNDLAGATAYLRAPKVGMLNLQSPRDLTIASGTIDLSGTVASLYIRRTRIRVDTEGSAASDDLDTISGGQDGDVLILRANNDGRTIVCKDSTGNLRLNGDFSLDNTNDRITLESDGSNWFELSRSDNAA